MLFLEKCISLSGVRLLRVSRILETFSMYSIIIYVLGLWSIVMVTLIIFNFFANFFEVLLLEKCIGLSGVRLGFWSIVMVTFIILLKLLLFYSY